MGWKRLEGRLRLGVCHYTAAIVVTVIDVCSYRKGGAYGMRIPIDNRLNSDQQVAHASACMTERSIDAIAATVSYETSKWSGTRSIQRPRVC